MLRYLQIKFSNMEIVSVSGNYCTDKKPSAINWYVCLHTGFLLDDKGEMLGVDNSRL